MMRFLSVPSVLAALVAVGVYFLYDPPRQCFHDLSSSGACLFSDSYFAARCRFREAAAARNASLTTLPVGSAPYTIDVALVNQHALADRVVMVSSGVHGVEGFAGSAVQLAILNGGVPDNVCVVLVHAVNPFGFAELRRWNENGVDLNRNALFTKEQWDEVLKRDPNLDGYENFLDFVVPTDAPNFFRDLFNSVRLILKHGQAALKKAIVPGSYVHENGLFFGGKELQESHRVLSQFFRERGITGTKRIFSMDVHAGLGPRGMDSLMIQEKASYDAIQRAIQKVQPEIKPYALELGERRSSDPNKEFDGASQGYENVRGFFENYKSLFDKKTAFFSCTQEFGTYPGVLVMLALHAENQAYHFLPMEERSPYAWRVREVFNPTSQRFREQVVLRGSSLFRLACEIVKGEK